MDFILDLGRKNKVNNLKDGQERVEMSRKRADGGGSQVGGPGRTPHWGFQLVT